MLQDKHHELIDQQVLIVKVTHIITLIYLQVLELQIQSYDKQEHSNPTLELQHDMHDL